MVKIIEQGLYKITDSIDGVVVWAKYYTDALEAAQDWVKFIDHGNAKYERVISFIVSGKNVRTKRFSTIAVVK
jgi:hypothetical protein